MLTLTTALLFACPQIVGGEFKKLATIRNGYAPDAALGNHLRTIGDVDGDRVSEFALAIPNADLRGRRDAGIVLVFSGLDGAFLREFEFQVDDLRYGIAMDGAGDFDADGSADIIIGGHRDTASGPLGYVHVWSVRTGAMLFSISSTSSEGLGTAVAGLGDLNGDGHDEIAIGRPGVNAEAGVIDIYGGATGGLLGQFAGLRPKERIGYSVRGVGDLDRDGVPDLLTANLLFSPGNASALGRVVALSGATGQQIWERIGSQSGEILGWDMAAAGDVDGDGSADVIVGAPGWGPNDRVRPGGALVLSGVDGRILLGVAGPHHRSNFGSAVDGGVDLNDDGILDVMVGAPFATMPNGAATGGGVFLFSGSDGERLHTFPGRDSFGALGSDVAFIGRDPGNGHVRLALGEPGHYEPTGYGGARLVVFRPYLTTSSTTLAASGGMVTAQIDFPDSAAGAPYSLLLSRSGRTASDFLGLTIPLVQDTLFARCVAGNYPLGISGGVGVLDAFGDATASYTAWTPVLARSVGATFWVAAIALHPGSGQPERSSIAVPLTIL